MDPALATIGVAVIMTAGVCYSAVKSAGAAEQAKKAACSADKAHEETKIVRIEINGHMTELLKVNEELKQAAMIIARSEGIEEGLARAAETLKQKEIGAKEERNRTRG